MIERAKKSWPLLVWIVAIVLMAIFVLMKQNKPSEALYRMVGKNISVIDTINPYLSKISSANKPIRLVLLSTRCEACEKLAQEMKYDSNNQFFTIVIFYRADKAEIDAWIKKHNVKFDFVIPDPNGKALVDMGARFLPTTLVAEPDGTITGVNE